VRDPREKVRDDGGMLWKTNQMHFWRPGPTVRYVYQSTSQKRPAATHLPNRSRGKGRRKSDQNFWAGWFKPPCRRLPTKRDV